VAQILRVSIFGTMPGGEVWSVNPCWEINGSTGDPVSPAQALTIATALGGVAVPAAMTVVWNAGTAITGYRVEARSLTGNLEAQGEYVRPAPVVGTGTSSHPYGTALVLSLRTPGVGGRSRGRMYWPATGMAISGTDLRVTSGTVGTVLAGMKTYLSGLETAIQATLPNANLTVWSRTSSNFHNVNSLQLGNVLDSQRRRRDSLIEAYQAVTYP